MNDCQQPICTCDVPTGKSYCSEACNKHETDHASGKCVCAHPECKGKTVPLAAEGATRLEARMDLGSYPAECLAPGTMP